ncbi:antitoxin VbhA family protein [Kribbella sp. NPDC054772]
MAYEPCRYAQRWPDLFDQLDDDQKQRVSDALANNPVENWEPERDDVVDLVDRELGRIDTAEYIRRTMSKVTRGV